SKRASSGPRPLRTSMDVKIRRLRSSVFSPNTHRLEGDLAQEIVLAQTVVVTSSGDPPAIGIRMSFGSFRSPGQSPELLNNHLPSGLTAVPRVARRLPVPVEMRSGASSSSDCL